MYIWRVGEVNGAINTDGKDPWHLSGLEVLRYISVNGGSWDVA